MSLKRLAPGMGLFALVLVVYFPTTWALSIWDDESYLLGNPNLGDFAGLARIWFSPRSSPQYYPVVFTSFWLESHLWGFTLGGYHGVNAFFHALSTVLVWRALRVLQLPGAWFAAAVFGLHPVHVESVAWITERKNVLSGFFYLLALSAYWKFSSPEPSQKTLPASTNSTLQRNAWGWYAGAFLAFLAALGSKTVTCSLPAALLLIVWWKQGRLPRRDLLALLPFFLVGVVASSHTAWLERYHVGAIGPDWSFSFLERTLIAGRALWFYAGKLFFPWKLAFIYTRWHISTKDWTQYLFPLTAVAVPIVLWALRKRIGRGPLTGVLFFAGTLFPALGFFNVFPMVYSFVADHFQYLASLGLIVPSATFMDATVRRLRLGGPATAVRAEVCVLFVLAVLTLFRETVFNNKWSLWNDTLAKNPTCWMAHNNLGLLYMERRLLEEAKNHFGEALRINPNSLEARYNRGAIFEEQGRFDEANQELEKVLEVNPYDWKAHFVIGLILKKQGRFDAAAERFRTSLRYNPMYKAAADELKAVQSRVPAPTRAG